VAKKKQKTISVESKLMPHKYQYEMYEKWKRYNVAITCRGWGKTVFDVGALHEGAMNAPEPAVFAYICPKKAQAWTIVRPILHKFFGHLQSVPVGAGQKPVEVINIKDSVMEVHYSNGCVLKAFGADYPNCEVIRGNTFAGVVIDEFDDIPFDVWLEIISPCLRGGGWALFTGTVKPGSNLYRLLDQYEDDDDWNFGIYKFEDCWEDLPPYSPIENPGEYEGIKKRFENSPNKYAREYQCDPTASDDDVVIPTDLIYAAQGKHMPKEAYSSAAKVMGVDVATGGGEDNSSICRRQGLVCHPIKEYNLDNMALADQIIRAMSDWEAEDGQPVDALFIDKGRGEGVISRLKQLGYSPIGVDFGGRAAKDIYRDKRVEMYHDGVRNWLMMGGALPDDKKLVQELATPTLIPVDGSKFVMEPKKKIREKLGRSPDSSDALGLTFAAPVHKRAENSRRGNIQSVSSTGYSPLSNRWNKQRRSAGYGIFR